MRRLRHSHRASSSEPLATYYRGCQHYEAAYATSPRPELDLLWRQKTFTANLIIQSLYVYLSRTSSNNCVHGCVTRLTEVQPKWLESLWTRNNRPHVVVYMDFSKAHLILHFSQDCTPIILLEWVVRYLIELKISLQIAHIKQRLWLPCPI